MIREFEPLIQKTPFLLFIRGIPGSGKTTIANLIAGAIFTNCEIIDPDLVDINDREFLEFKKACDHSFSDRLVMYRYLLTKVKDLLNGSNNVIWTQAWTKIWGIEDVLDKFGKDISVNYNVIVVSLSTTREIAEERIKERDRQLTIRSLDDFLDNFENIPKEWRPEVPRLVFNTVQQSPDEVAKILSGLLGTGSYD